MSDIKICVNALSLQPNHKGGAESVFLNLAKGFRSQGYAKNITYFCYPEMAEAVKKITSESKVIIIENLINEKHARISAEIVQTKVFHRIYKKYKFDVILFANSEVGLFKYNVPTVVIPHDIQNVSRPEINKSKFQYYLNYFSYRSCFKNIDKIIAISNEDKKDIEKHYDFSKNKIVKIYDPLDISEDKIRHVSTKQEYIFAVNIQYEHKNIDTLIKAFSIFSKRNPTYKLYLAGAKNNHTDKLEKLVNQLNLSEKVVFLGFVDKEKLLDYWSKTKLYVNPSLFEGFGMTSVESIIYGAPTLLGDLKINREVTDGLCTYYEDLKNPIELAEEMEKMIKEKYDEDIYMERAKKIAKKYNLKEISKQYINLLLKLSMRNNECEK